jgi:hypothetical protein
LGQAQKRSGRESKDVIWKNMPLVEEKELLDNYVHIPPPRLRWLRESNKIPFIKTGRLSVLYDPEKVIAALQKLEAKPGRKPEKRKFKAEAA